MEGPVERISVGLRVDDAMGRDVGASGGRGRGRVVNGARLGAVVDVVLTIGPF